MADRYKVLEPVKNQTISYPNKTVFEILWPIMDYKFSRIVTYYDSEFRSNFVCKFLNDIENGVISVGQTS